MSNSKKVRDRVLNAAQDAIMKDLDLDEPPAIGICFTKPPDFKECHFITNVTRADGIKLFSNTATRMRTQMN